VRPPLAGQGAPPGRCDSMICDMPQPPSSSRRDRSPLCAAHPAPQRPKDDERGVRAPDRRGLARGDDRPARPQARVVARVLAGAGQRQRRGPQPARTIERCCGPRMVGETGFEPATPWSRSRTARYINGLTPLARSSGQRPGGSSPSPCLHHHRYCSQNVFKASCRPFTLENPRPAAAASKPPNCLATAEALLP
jgi:hypothetical protein